ncbi:MAG: Na-translocating system protein MpsC family protein [Thermoleophilaceae bacterium]
MRGGDLTTRHGPGHGQGELLADISRALVQVYKECYGKGPTKARTYMSDDLVVCLLEGGFNKSEQTLRDAGRGAVVAEQREAFQEVLRKRFVDTVEELVGRRVATFISGVDLESETSAELFVLEPQELELGDEREAVAAWGEQTRRQSRVLRDERAALSETHEEISQRRRSRDEPERFEP